MARRKESTTVYVEPEDAARMRDLFEKTRVPMAERYRQGVALLFQRLGILPDPLAEQMAIALGAESTDQGKPWTLDRVLELIKGLGLAGGC